jgi:hypothetical protein
MAAYRSSSLASATPKSSASVVVCHQRVVASLVCGATMREAIIASTKSRSRQGLAPSSEANPRRCMASATAWTWPCERDAVISKDCATGCNASPRNVARIASICAAERLDKLASVRLPTLEPSR